MGTAEFFAVSDAGSVHFRANGRVRGAQTFRCQPEKASLSLFYLPAYSPDFNRDEGVWSHLKSQELKAQQATNKSAVKERDGWKDLYRACREVS